MRNCSYGGIKNPSDNLAQNDWSYMQTLEESFVFVRKALQNRS
jgi:hypothetical protein